jgi:hypothetical protein
MYSEKKKQLSFYLKLIDDLSLCMLRLSLQGHEFAVTCTHTGVTKTFYARASGGTHFVLLPETFHPRLAVETAAVRVVCVLRRPAADEVRIDVFPEWSPRGAARFLDLVNDMLLRHAA